MSFFAWIKKLRHPKRISCGGGEITAEEWRSAATLMRRRGSNPPAPPPGSKQVPFSPDPPSPVFRSRIMSYAEAMEDHKQELAQLNRLQLSAPSTKPQPTGGRLICGDVDPGPVPSPLLLAIRSAIDNEPFGDEPRAVLLVVAQWLRSRNAQVVAARLEIEASK